MAVSEDRLQILVPKRLKERLTQTARRKGISVGRFVRELIRAGLDREEPGHARAEFPFGEDPIRTGRKNGSTSHDRP